MILKKYIEVENVYASIYRDEAKIINAIKEIIDIFLKYLKNLLNLFARISLTFILNLPLVFCFSFIN